MTVAKLKAQAQLVDADGKGTREFMRNLSDVINNLQTQIDARAALGDTTASLTDQLTAITSQLNSVVGSPFLVGAFIPQAADPVAADLPDGYFAMFKSPSGVCLWANDGGVLKKVALI